MIQRLQAKRNEEGFTLIELLIVIIVLGILAAIVVFAIGSTRKDSVAASCKTNYKAVELSLEAVNTKMGAMPATNETPAFPVGAATSPLLAGNTLGAGGTSSNGALLKAWPTSSDYFMRYDGTSTSIQIYKTTPALTETASGGVPTIVVSGAAVPATPATGSGVAQCDGL
jgi:general secretion pathway protein G